MSAMNAEFSGQTTELFALSTMTLATTGAGGEPHAAPVYFATGESLRLYFFSEETSQHSRDIAGDPRAAAAIYAEGQDWREIHGLQLRGVVKAVPAGPEWEAAWKQYVAKFPFAAGLKEIVRRNTLYVFVPHWIRLVDNRRGFGFKEEWILRGPEE